jgi:hypothetical protein
MDNYLLDLSSSMPAAKTYEEIRQCNALTKKYNLALSDSQIKSLVEKRAEALKNAGRVEFGPGILRKLIMEFCDSLYIEQETYADTLAELQEIFYYFKSEALDILSDDELLHAMKQCFDGEGEGSLDYLRETGLEELCRSIRFGRHV